MLALRQQGIRTVDLEPRIILILALVRKRSTYHLAYEFLVLYAGVHRVPRGGEET